MAPTTILVLSNILKLHQTCSLNSELIFKLVARNDFFAYITTPRPSEVLEKNASYSARFYNSVCIPK